MASRKEQIDEVLNDLMGTTTDIQGVSVITPDGMMIANMLSKERGDAAAAMGAAMSSLGNRVAETLKVGRLQEINIRGTNAHILVFDIAQRAALLLQVAANANLGLVLLEARYAQQRLSGIL
ncbi:MAG: roadblock/LC7 domain-containing protein [Mariprofundales bacterium]